MKLKEYNVQGTTYRMQLFDKIESKEQSYLIGYMLGDGGFNAGTHKRKPRLFVSSTEKYIIESFRDNFTPDSPISSRIPVNTTRNIVSKIESHRLQFPSKFYETFYKFGIVSVKTERTYHNIGKNNMNTFLLGLFDADGCVTWGRRKDRNRLWASYSITHPNLNMLKKLQGFLVDNVGVMTIISPKGDEKCFVLRTSNREYIKKIINYMYSDKPNVFNITKYDNCQKYLEAFANN